MIETNLGTPLNTIETDAEFAVALFSGELGWFARIGVDLVERSVERARDENVANPVGPQVFHPQAEGFAHPKLRPPHHHQRQVPYTPAAQKKSDNKDYVQ